MDSVSVSNRAEKNTVTTVIYRVGFCVLFALLIAAGAWIRIPLPWTPVPLTLQTFFVLLGAALGGPGLGAGAALLYTVMGAAGLPFFAGGASGFGVLIGPTGGYIMGFIAAALAVGSILSKPAKVGPLKLCGTLFLGSLIIYACGILILSVFFPGGKPVQLMLMGVLPFLPGDLLKIFAAGIIYRALSKKLKSLI
ncbi:MAG: biotin transporter BioY [Chloroflexi bacterium]|nr:biotin transporter BioY [Chloroflexota bacterium]